MSRCEELRANAAGIASLAASATERVQAYAHARPCPDCLTALEEGERLITLLDSTPLEAPSAAALAAARAAVLDEMAGRAAPAPATAGWTAGLWVSLAAQVSC